MPQPAGIDYEVMAEALRSLDGIHLPPGLKGLPPNVVVSRGHPPGWQRPA